MTACRVALRDLRLPLCLFDEPTQRQLIYAQQKSETWLMRSVRASFRANHRKRGSWVWRKAWTATITVWLYCTCIASCLVYSLGMQMGQWKLLQQIGKCFASVCHENQCHGFRRFHEYNIQRATDCIFAVEKQYSILTIATIPLMTLSFLWNEIILFLAKQ